MRSRFQPRRLDPLQENAFRRQSMSGGSKVLDVATNNVREAKVSPPCSNVIEWASEPHVWRMHETVLLNDGVSLNLVATRITIEYRV